MEEKFILLLINNYFNLQYYLFPKKIALYIIFDVSADIIANLRICGFTSIKKPLFSLIKTKC